MRLYHVWLMIDLCVFTCRGCFGLTLLLLLHGIMRSITGGAAPHQFQRIIEKPYWCMWRYYVFNNCSLCVSVCPRTADALACTLLLLLHESCIDHEWSTAFIWEDHREATRQDEESFFNHKGWSIHGSKNYGAWSSKESKPTLFLYFSI